MTADVESLLDTLLRLPVEDRLVVADVLIDSVSRESVDEVEAAWVIEAKQRLERVHRGESIPVATAVVEQELDELVARSG